MRARSRWFVATIVLGTSTGCQSAHELPPIDGSLDVLVDSPAESPPEARPEHRLAMTWSHACFLDDVSRLFCWGSNVHGELGVGIAPTLDEGAVYEPMWVSDDFVVVSVGVWSTAAIDETGALWGWGRNASGWLEDGTQDDATRPIRIGTDNDWIDVAVGSGVVCAIHAGGGAECWGRGDYGESTPAPIEPGEPRHVHPEGTFVWTVGGGWYHQYLRRTDRTWLHVVHDRGTISFEPVRPTRHRS